MKNKNSPIIKIFLTLSLSLIIGFVLFSGVYGFVIFNNPDVITIGIDEKYTLTPTKKEFSLRSYHPDIVAPAGGCTVSGETNGEGVVCIKYSYFDRDFYKFRIIEPPKEITLNKNEVTLGKGETFSLNADAKSSGHSFNVEFISSNDSVATVSQDGVISALSVGECDIIARTYNSIESRCSVCVKEAPRKISFDKSEVALGKTEEISLSVNFSDNEYASTVSYQSDNEKVATIENGLLTAVGEGECTITATCYNNTQAKCSVSVKPLPQSVELINPEKHIVNTSFPVLYEIDSDTQAHNIDVSVSDESVLKIDETDPTLIHCLKKGTSQLTLTLPNGVSATKTITVDDYKKNSINFTTLNQYPYLPTGCEVVSLTSVLRHYGCDIDAVTMADKYMPKVSYDYYSVSPHDYFLGDPHSRDGFGCFSGCLLKTAENYFKDKSIYDFVAVDISGCTTDELYSYLLNDIPVITWVTSGFVTPTNDGSWVVGNETITWCNHEHCLVTTGYDKNAGTVTVADNSGGYNYSVSKEQFEKVFKGMGSMAVAVLKK